MKITAPAAADLTGEYVSSYGPVRLVFRDGVAEHDGDLPDGVRAYLKAAGYGLDGSSPADQPETYPEPEVDARDLAGQRLVGTPLRDAAVDPEGSDFLAPVNAGEADPHGPWVVAPGIHAEGERVVASGPVWTDPDAQQANEKRLAEKLLVDREQVVPPVAAEDFLEEGGPLGLSDPGSAQIGADQAGESTDLTTPAGDAAAVTPAGSEPRGNARLADWQAFAREQGASDDDLEGKSRDDLRAAYGS